MLHPSYTDLMEVVNGSVEEGKEPLVSSRYSIVMATAKRARQITDGSEPRVKIAKTNKALSLAVEELYEGKIHILDEEAEA
ncbi:MAG TPA: DNA-directed RNA polymerase subunit omega [Eubacterium sp.]|nr:DNA-directed RNA polymerase subunit omega [Eubacterium sp.]